MSPLLKTLKFALPLAACIMLIKPVYNTADASTQTNDIASKIQQNNQTFAKMLNAKSEPEKLMQFMHKTIDNDAQIKMTINNPELEDAGVMEVKLSKADYINSYLYGPRQVKNYRADIQTVNVEVDESSNVVKTKDILIESGIMLDPRDHQAKGRDFTSRTTCESKHTLDENQDVQLEASVCHTDIQYPQSI